MRRRYPSGLVTAKVQTDKAVLCSFDWSRTHGYVASDVWVPLSVIHEDDHDTIENAAEGSIIEIGIAEWWLNKL